ncbi:MAG: alpha/beta fold hydrolase [Planctomycetota bacterium]
MPELIVLFLVAGSLIVLITSALYAREARRPTPRTTAYALVRGLASEPSERHLDFRAWSVERPGRVTIPVWEIDGHGDARTIVMVHGWGQSRINMLARIGPFLPHARRIVMYDLRGHGEADGGISRLGVDEADDLHAVVDGLDSDDPLVLVGFSMGAAIAFEALPAMPSPVERIIAYGVYDTFHKSFQGRVRVMGYPARPMTHLAMGWFRLCGLRHRRVVPALESASVPVDLLHGAHDIVSPLQHMQELDQRAPHVTLHTFERARHLDMPFVEPDRHAAVIQSILTDQA